MGDSKKSYDAVLFLKKKVIVLPSGDVFRNANEVLKYLKNMWDENKLPQFRGFYSCNRFYLKSSVAELKKADHELFCEITSNYRNMFCIDEHYFRNADDFVDFVCILIECQVKYKMNIYDKFFEKHRETVNNVASVKNDVKIALEKIRQFYGELSESVISSGLSKTSSIELIAETVDKLSFEFPKNLKNGQIIVFGKYFKRYGKKKEPLEWRVLQTDGKNALLITENAIDCKQYHHEDTDVSWNDCDLRKWCNEDFIMEAFSETEKKLIVTSSNKNNYGPETDDLVFCLSAEEAGEYFTKDNDRVCSPTQVALKNEAYTDKNSCTYWWLRSKGNYYYCAAHVLNNGSIRNYGDFVSDNIVAVRLAGRINLDLLP
jgi:hypothetical protein